MRISVDVDDPGCAAWVAVANPSAIVVRLDGAIVRRCITADTDAGFVVVIDADEHGRVRLKDACTAARKTLHGKVEISF